MATQHIKNTIISPNQCWGSEIRYGSSFFGLRDPEVQLRLRLRILPFSFKCVEQTEIMLALAKNKIFKTEDNMPVGKLKETNMKKGRKESDPDPQRYGSRDPDPYPYQNATDPQHCIERPGSSTNLIPLVAGAWRTSMWWGRAMVSRGPDPSLTQLKVMVAWSPDELALTYYTHCGLRFVPRTNMGMIMEHWGMLETGKDKCAVRSTNTKTPNKNSYEQAINVFQWLDSGKAKTTGTCFRAFDKANGEISWTCNKVKRRQQGGYKEISSILADQYSALEWAQMRGAGLSYWVQLCTWSPNKLYLNYCMKAANIFKSLVKLQKVLI
jgi:hypothetical protein